MLLEFYFIVMWLGGLAAALAQDNSQEATRLRIDNEIKHLKARLRQLKCSSETRGIRLPKTLWNYIRIYGMLHNKSANDVVKTAVEEFFHPKVIGIEADVGTVDWGTNVFFRQIAKGERKE